MHNASPLTRARRIVVKVGSALLVDQSNGQVNRPWLETLVEDLLRLRARRQEVVLVSSGAIALGRRELKLSPGPLKLQESQAAAAVGQIALAHIYKELFAGAGVTVAQILLTLEDSERRRRYLNARATLSELLELGALPVINENDTVATTEIRYGDNDRLAARVAQMTSADCLLLLSDVTGLYTADPNLDPSARLIPEIRDITPEIEAMGGGSASAVGTGGMATKIAAAKIATAAGCAMAIAAGAPLHPVRRLEEGADCSWFLPSSNPENARKQWIAGSLRPTGAITIDAGALQALRSGKSLLPAGVTAVSGRFSRGDTVSVLDQAGAEIARGMIAYSDQDSARISGKRSADIEALLGFRGRDEMIHRDDLVLMRVDLAPVREIFKEFRLNAAVDTPSTPEIAALMDRLGRDAAAAAAVLALATTATKNLALAKIAASLRVHAPELLAANARDMDAARGKGLSAAMLDRLALDARRIESMARGVEEIAALADPIGTTLAQWTRPNGLDIARVRVPLGVIGIIFESRPNVTSDAGALCLKSGNAAILRGGSESVQSNRAIHACLVEGLVAAGLPAACLQLVPTTDRAAVGYLLSSMTDYVDVVVPRGGKSLVARVQQEARVPVIGHLEGVCHVFVDRDADLAMARGIVQNAKLRRTGVCGSAETLLVDAAVVATHLAPVVKDLLDAGCEVRGDAAVQKVDPRVIPATEQDWYTEYLDAIIAARVVDGVDAAIEHIAKYGSAHTDSIVTGNAVTAQRFLDRVDSAIVLHNASTQFADGGEFGMGAEIGISTDRFHARGPVGVEQLTSYKYVVRGSGQIRP